MAFFDKALSLLKFGSRKAVADQGVPFDEIVMSDAAVGVMEPGKALDLPEEVFEPSNEPSIDPVAETSVLDLNADAVADEAEPAISAAESAATEVLPIEPAGDPLPAPLPVEFVPLKNASEPILLGTIPIVPDRSPEPAPEAASLAESAPSEAPAAMAEEPVMDAPAIETALAAADASALSAPVGAMTLSQTEEAATADDSKPRDPLVDQLIISLMEDARQRAASTISAYETLSVKVTDYALRSNKNARTAWRMVGSLAALIAIGGVGATYALTHAWGKVDQYKSNARIADVYSQIEKGMATDRAAAAVQTKQMHAELTQAIASVKQIQVQQQVTAAALKDELREAQDARLRAEEQLRAERAQQAAAAFHPSPSSQPATAPTAARTGSAEDNWATLLNGR